MTLTEVMISIMSANTSFFSKRLSQILIVIEQMATPEGTTINELSKRLSITRRSVFRLIRTIEHTFNIPIITKREKFGGHATYHLAESFIEMLTNIKTSQLNLSFNQAVLFYLIFKNEINPS